MVGENHVQASQLKRARGESSTKVTRGASAAGAELMPRSSPNGSRVLLLKSSLSTHWRTRLNRLKPLLHLPLERVSEILHDTHAAKCRSGMDEPRWKRKSESQNLESKFKLMSLNRSLLMQIPES